MDSQAFEILDGEFSYYKLQDLPDVEGLPETQHVFFINTAGDRSLMMPSGPIQFSYEAVAPGWRCLKLTEAFDFTAIGIAADITSVLATAGVSVLVMSGYSHDYFFVKNDSLAPAVNALEGAGYSFR